MAVTGKDVMVRQAAPDVTAFAASQSATGRKSGAPTRWSG